MYNLGIRYIFKFQGPSPTVVMYEQNIVANIVTGVLMYRVVLDLW